MAIIKFCIEQNAQKEKIQTTPGGYVNVIYVKNIDETKVRVIFAHDYNLFLNDDIDDYCFFDYEISCDFIVEKKKLLRVFYNIYYPITINFNPEDDKFPDFDKENAIKHLKKIEQFLYDRI